VRARVAVAQQRQKAVAKVACGRVVVAAKSKMPEGVRRRSELNEPTNALIGLREARREGVPPRTFRGERRGCGRVKVRL